MSDHFSKDPTNELSIDNKQAWIVKVPKFLYNQWSEAKPSDQLGKLSIQQIQKSKDYEISLSTLDTVQSYSVSLTPSTCSVLLSDNSILGRVVSEGSIRPVYNREYSQIMKNRLVDSNIRSSTKVLEGLQQTQSYLNPKLANISVKQNQLVTFIFIFLEKREIS